MPDRLAVTLGGGFWWELSFPDRRVPAPRLEVPERPVQADLPGKSMLNAIRARLRPQTELYQRLAGDLMLFSGVTFTVIVTDLLPPEAEIR